MVFWSAIYSISVISGQARGTITATVLDRTGEPVSGATVQMLRAEESNGTGVVRACLTDKSGLCSESLAFGKYRVVPMKLSDGYPDLSFNFYGHGRWPWTVEISPENPNAYQTIKLGPKAGFVVLHVFDAVSGARIQRASVILRPVADPHDFLSTNLGSDSTILVPPDEQISAEVSAEGYKSAAIENDSGSKPRNSISVPSGKSIEISVRLQPNSAVRPASR